MLYFLNNYTFPPLYRIVEGNFLEQHKEIAGCNSYYIDYKCQGFNICILHRWKLSNTTKNNREKAN